MSKFDDAKSLLQHATFKIKEIRLAYDASLNKKAVDPSLLIEIKNFMENLRSALDFSACGLFEKYGSSKKPNPKIYFPYAPLSQGEIEFRMLGRVESSIPGIELGNPEVLTKIESYQHFSEKGFKWLPVFMELNNANKHQQLTPQEKKETRQLNITAGGAAISICEGGSISLPQGASIQMGGATITGGQVVSVNNLAKTEGPAHQEIITWVSFHFSTNNESVLPFLEKALLGVGEMVDELSQL